MACLRHCLAALVSSGLALAVVVPAAAAGTSCPQHFADGAAPSIVNPALTQRAKELCFASFAVMHSGLMRTPLWSAEHLTRDALERARVQTRVNAFHPELRLPGGERAELPDYARSGLDRGHMAPSGDMPDPGSQAESFSLANMVPQDPDLNRHLWEGIESAVRDLARRRGELYVLTGPLFEGKDLGVLKGRVYVPSSVYKLVFDPQSQEAAAYIAINQPTSEYRVVSVAELERRAGIIFLAPSILPAVARNRPMGLPFPQEHGKGRGRSNAVFGL